MGGGNIERSVQTIPTPDLEAKSDPARGWMV